MKVQVEGSGELVMRLINTDGRTVMDRRVTISGSATVQAVIELPLLVQTGSGRQTLIPLLLPQPNSQQKVTFNGFATEEFTKLRCAECDCVPAVTEKALQGLALPPESAELMSDSGMQDVVEQMLAASRT